MGGEMGAPRVCDGRTMEAVSPSTDSVCLS